METKLSEAMTSGVFVEFCDAQGAGAGQAVYLDWRGKPLPNVGDALCCEAADVSGRRRKLAGRVASRHARPRATVPGRGRCSLLAGPRPVRSAPHGAI